jgi:hypothetical protein
MVLTREVGERAGTFSPLAVQHDNLSGSVGGVLGTRRVMMPKGFVALSLTALLLLFYTAPTQAQSYPNKTIRLVVPFGPGGPTDVAARVVAQVLQSDLGQSVVIENRPGAGGATGSKSVATANPMGTRCCSQPPQH